MTYKIHTIILYGKLKFLLNHYAPKTLLTNLHLLTVHHRCDTFLKKPHLSRWKYDPKKNKKSYKYDLLNCVSDFKSPNKYRLGGKNYYIFLKEDKFNIIKNFIDKKLKN